MFSQISFKTQLGWISIRESNKKIASVEFGKNRNIGKSKNLNKFKNQIQDYALGKLKKFKIDIFLDGTATQKKIWHELQKIPYGKTTTYGQIANKLNTSPRYVGNVCGQNKHLLVIPCHRVIRSDGSLGGFSSLGGIKLKERLIHLEKNE